MATGHNYIAILYPVGLIIGVFGNLLSCLCVRHMPNTTHPETKFMMFSIGLFNLLALILTFVTRYVSNAVQLKGSFSI